MGILILFIHQLIGIWIQIMLLWIFVHTFCRDVFISIRNGISGRYGNSVCLKKWQTVSQSSISILHTPTSPHPCQYLLLSMLLAMAILVHVEWYLVVLICIFLIAKTRDLFKKIGNIKGTFHPKMGTINKGQKW